MEIILLSFFLGFFVITILTYFFKKWNSNRVKNSDDLKDQSKKDEVKIKYSGIYSSESASSDQDCIQPLPEEYHTSLEGYKLIKKLWDKDCKLHEQGREYCEKEARINFNNLLGINQQILEHPEMRDIEIKRPIFIVAWLRTGSTLLHNLLAVDPRIYTPHLWELLYPLTISDSSDIREDVIKRKEMAHKEMEDFYKSGFEDFRCIHELRAEYPDECCHIFERCFASRHIPIMGQAMDEYTEWFANLSEDQISDIYKLYKAEIQYHTYCKQQREPPSKDEKEKQWCFKDETHMYFLEGLLKTFPDAIIINLHRDPVQVLGSTVSGFNIIMKVYYPQEDIDDNKLARRCLQQMQICKDRLMHVRSRVKELTGREESDVFIDIKYKDLCENEKNIVSDIYKRIGNNCTDIHLLEMTRYLFSNPKSKHGKHLYDITDFGLTKAEIRDKFQDYIDKFL